MMFRLLSRSFPAAWPPFFLLVFLVFLAPDLRAQDAGQGLKLSYQPRSDHFPLVSASSAAPLFFDPSEATVVRIAARALQEDIRRVSGRSTRLDSGLRLSPYSLIIGTLGNSRLIDSLDSRGKIRVKDLRGQWEQFSISVVNDPGNGGRQALVIAGSDPRGTAFGVFELSRRIGVDPFYWWADLHPHHHPELYFSPGSYTAPPPSVRYRGIFLNDEDWGLQPWAAKTFEPETGDIGPKTYARIFELLLRLKANLIWPAMHPSTRAFFHYPGNPQVAADYAILVGSSHAEPMLRNNVSEWDEKKMGRFNYLSNRQKVYDYWEERVRQSKDLDAIYTLGMRGVHDSRMEGVKDDKEAVPLVERIMAEQRALLQKHLGRRADSIPQVFTAYKEVLDIYDAGLRLPEDLTLVWPDDNYGYIQRLNNEAEKQRPGGAGVYYHASYWGRPHDYLWLPSTHPGLLREEIVKAYDAGARRLWVLNVGDLKPQEYNIQQFMDMAWNIQPFQSGGSVRQHLLDWTASLFGRALAPELSEVLWNYYQLAFERKPEFMGWSQTEPTTPTSFTQYNSFYYGDEATRRLARYEALEQQVRRLEQKISPNRRDAFYQLIRYPVTGASLMNKKFLYRHKADLYARQQRLSAARYAAWSQAAFDSIASITRYYNEKMSGGKWKGMMSMSPRNLPVFQAPASLSTTIDSSRGWGLAPEGWVRADSSLLPQRRFPSLPPFDEAHASKYFIDIFLSRHQVLDWTALPSAPWILISQKSGRLVPAAGKEETRLEVTIDWKRLGARDSSGSIRFRAGGREVVVHLSLIRWKAGGSEKVFVENNGYLSIHARNFSRQTRTARWQRMEGLGYAGSVLQSPPIPEDAPLTDTSHLLTQQACVEYDLETRSGASPTLYVYTIPTHPLNNRFGMRYAVSVDDSPLQLVSFRTVGRSEEWKQNVLRNRAERRIALPYLAPGRHVLKLYAIDPGVLLDEIRIDLGGLQKAYGLLPETRGGRSF